MDVNTIFLNGKLKEIIYIQQLKGFINDEYKDKVYFLKKSLYGLKQSPRHWCFTLYKAISNIDYTTNQLDHYIYVRNSGSQFCILFLYINGILLIRNGIIMISKSEA